MNKLWWFWWPIRFCLVMLGMVILSVGISFMVASRVEDWRDTVNTVRGIIKIIRIKRKTR